ncbi:MAG: NADH-quinone oxidoreductase subunit M [Anaerolineae bacterium]|nr:NADH-quinone oxidoreductase subunit M [Anaerolineae bacterium]
MHFPILSALIFIPLVAGVLLLILPADRKNLLRAVALAAASLMLVLAAVLYLSFRPEVVGYQFLERVDWLPALGISYYVGVDGISVPLIMLAALVVFCGVLVSWNISERQREYFAYLMFLGASVVGVFASLDLFMLFFFFELAVFPKFLMIVLWGYPKTRSYGGMKLTLYLYLGSVLALVGALAIYFGAGMRTFDMLALEQAGFAIGFQRIWFPVVFIGFGILAGIFPLHNWAPDGHVAAPTAVSMLLAGVEMKVGAFAALRVGIMLLPEGARSWAWLILILGTINVVYGAFIAMIQKDFKYVIGYSSVSHMGLVLIGFASLNRQGLVGAGMQMFSHGIMTALFFAIVGMVYDRTHDREIANLGGLVRKMPWAAVGFIIAGLVSMGMPGFSGFVAEFPIFMGVWRVAPPVAIIAIIGVLVTAAYIFVVVRRVFFGELPSKFEQSVGDITIRDKIVIALLAGWMVALGLFPSIMTPMMESGVDHILALLGGG